jgi:hypothetical protein
VAGILQHGKALFALGQKVERHQLDIRALDERLADLRREVETLAAAVQELRLQQQHDRDMAAKDRENLLLRLENYVLRAERRLPPPEPEDPAAQERTR